MGFRDIYAFNLAMLAKQAWRLIQGTPSLFFRVYKARYFPNCSFMEAELGNNPLFVWRSLLETRNLIQAATMQEVGNGRSIKIDDHRWLPHPPQFRPDADKDLRVCDLFNLDTRQWHGQLLSHTSLPTIVAAITHINLGTTTSRDKLIWKENRKGIFSVKLAYRVALRMRQAEQVEHSSARQDKKLWNRIWQLQVPPKVRMFVWRACLDILPTCMKLCQRKIPVDPACAVCHHHDETVAHALWGCPMARNVWAMVPGKLQKRSLAVEEFYSLARELMEVLTTEEMEVWAIVSWAIWNARNRYLFDKKQAQPNDILRGAMTLLHEHQRLS